MVISSVVQSAEGPLYIIYIALAILGMVGASAGILAYIRGNLAKGTIELLQTANAVLEKEVLALKGDRASSEKTIAGLKQDVSRLTELVTQTKSVEKLNEDEKKRHEDLVIKIDQGFTRIVTAVEGGRSAPPRKRIGRAVANA